MLLRRPAKRRRIRTSVTASPEFFSLPAKKLEHWQQQITFIGDCLDVVMRDCPDAPTAAVLSILREGTATVARDMRRLNVRP